MKLLTTKEAALLKGVTPRRIRQLIQTKQLEAEQYGRDYLIKESALRRIKFGKPGRPPKDRKEKAAA